MDIIIFNIPRIIFETLKNWCSAKIPDVLSLKFKDREFNLPSVKMSLAKVRMFFSDKEYDENLYTEIELNKMNLIEEDCLNNGIRKYSIRVYPHELGYNFIYFMVEFGDSWKCYKYTGLADLISLKKKHSEWLENLECAKSFD